MSAEGRMVLVRRFAFFLLILMPPVILQNLGPRQELTSEAEENTCINRGIVLSIKAVQRAMPSLGFLPKRN